ncbi:MAG: aldo/keto reductase [Vallitaleaceae bacterium]|nr:aldo/keto reductase [Vallitaleaceae bacterium]
MKYRSISATDLKVAAICLGGGSFCLEDGQAHSFELMNTYFEQGGNFIDTANVYGKWLKAETNISEIVMGEWMHQRKNRHELIIASKGGHPDLATMSVSRLSREEVLKDLEESLKALKTDYIDLYWLHRDDENLPVATIMTYLNDLVKDGKIRYFGCSNWKVSRIKQAMEYCQKNHVGTFVGNQMRWSLAVPNAYAQDDQTLVSMDEECYEYHMETMLTAIPYASQANGFFEKLKDVDQVPLSDGIKRTYYNETNVSALKMVEKVAKELSLSITEVILGYLISQPFTTIPIIGSSSKEQLSKSLKAGDLALSKEVIELLNKKSNK